MSEKNIRCGECDQYHVKEVENPNPKIKTKGTQGMCKYYGLKTSRDKFYTYCPGAHRIPEEVTKVDLKAKK